MAILFSVEALFYEFMLDAALLHGAELGRVTNRRMTSKCARLCRIRGQGSWGRMLHILVYY